MEADAPSGKEKDDPSLTNPTNTHFLLCYKQELWTDKMY
jgi:hypothetical protein